MIVASAAAVDAAITQVAATNSSLSERLMQLANHSANGLLRATSGVSRARWDDAVEGLARLSRLHSRHCETLAALREIRGRRRRLAPADIDAVRLILDGAGAPVWPRSMADLAAEMERIADRVADVLDASARVWARLGSSTDRCAAQLAAADTHAAALGGRATTVVAPLRARLAAIQAIAVTDPLSRWSHGAVDAADADALETECRQAATELAGLLRLRDNAAAALADAAAAVRTVEQKAAAAAARRAAVEATIAEPPPGEPPQMGTTAIHALVAAARDRGGAADWWGFGAAIEQVHAATTDATARIDAALAEIDGPIRVRTELRHRLDLYRAKAAATGRAEDVRLDSLHRRAHEMLWTAPTNIDAADAALGAYRRAVNDGPEPGPRGDDRT